MSKQLTRQRVQEGTLLRAPVDRYSEWQRDYPYRYPKFLREMLRVRVRDMSFPLASYGFECGPGWAPILERLFDVAEARIAAMQPLARRNHQATQIKEKFGKLVVYILGNPPDSIVNRAIATAARESSVACERCGAPGTTTRNPKLLGWTVTRCPAHVDRFARMPQPGDEAYWEAREKLTMEL
jgi:hypothetical protein